MLILNGKGRVGSMGNALGALSKAAAIAAAALALMTWTGCQESDVSGPKQDGNPSLATGVKSMGEPSKSSPAGGTWLGMNATCKDKGPAEFGIAFKCTNDSDPVCGCDGKTYTNHCQAWGIGGVNVAHKGACEGEGPVTIQPIDPIDPIEDPTDPDTSVTIQPIDPIDPGHPPICGTPDPTEPDPIVVDPVVPDYPTCSEPVPDGTPKCTNEKHEVCGCDGKTYINSCLAWTYRTNVAHEGACEAGIHSQPQMPIK